jgi:hypothetical protein
MKSAFLWPVVAAAVTGFIIGHVGKCHADEWTRADTHREIAYHVVAWMDAATTADIKNHDDIEEKAPITRQVIGKNPSNGEVVAWFAATSVVHYGISRALPKPYRKYWQYVTIGVESAMVVNNVSLGLRWGF